MSPHVTARSSCSVRTGFPADSRISLPAAATTKGILLCCGVLIASNLVMANSACAQSLFQRRYPASPASPAPAQYSPAGSEPSPTVVQPQGQPASTSDAKPADPAGGPAFSPGQPVPPQQGGSPDGSPPTGQPGSSGQPGSGTTSNVIMPAIQQVQYGGPMSVRMVSLMAVIPPEPRLHKKQDKIELIINESSLSTSQQKLDSNKKFDFTAQLSQFPSLAAMLGDLELRSGIGTVPPRVGVNSSDKFKGDGKYERTDRMTARVSGLVSDVKPNGMLLIEARESIQQDEETKTLVISGLCDPKDITNANTVQSSQLANLTIKIEHGGQIKNSATKGLIPRFFETLFNF